MQHTTVAIVWHMHQPYYRDMLTGECSMPWVRLHGIHSYYDMIRLYEKFPNVNGTINFVPSLVGQLLAYVEEGKSDIFLEHTLVPAENLSPQQKAFILQYFFMANTAHKIIPYPSYYKLFTRRGLDPSRIDYQQAIRFFSTQDYLDIQVYYNLVWFGFAAREELPEIDKLLASGDHFTEEDKKNVIAAQKKILGNLLDGLRKAANSKNVEICTTPFYHPIFPLLIDNTFALRSNPKAPLPLPMRIPWMAKSQLSNALDSMERWTGKRPVGIWPAEGSVCPEMIPILADAGVKWMASDERVLGLSLPKEKREGALQVPYTAEFDGRKVDMIFRDHGLADLIGFTYSHMPAEGAIANFIGNIKKIDASAKSKRLVTVILDGENAWEFYPQSGKDFLTGLFLVLEREGIPTATVSGYLEKNRPSATITALHTGSWIDANFNIWIGKPQKNKAWTYIKLTLDALGSIISPERAKEDPAVAGAFECLSAACGSDWFWWYDDDFDSAFKPDFDRLFRTHLKNAFTALGKDIPPFLFEPIYRFTDTKGVLAEPPGLMFPVLDGKRSSFFEWANSIRFSVASRGGAMAISHEHFETISFGFNTDSLFLRFDPVDNETEFAMADDEELVFYIHDDSKNHKFIFKNTPDGFAALLINSDGSVANDNVPFKWAVESLLEVAISFAALGYKAGDKITLAIAFHRQGIESRRYSHIRFIAPDDTYEQHMWSV